LDFYRDMTAVVHSPGPSFSPKKKGPLKYNVKHLGGGRGEEAEDTNPLAAACFSSKKKNG
jgi:hypothetical protein